MSNRAATDLAFEGFILDLSRGCLRRGDAEIGLRPKSFEVLRTLAQNPGRLLGKEELLSAVWPNVTVTEEALTHCISEVRRALNDQDQKIIKTVPKRGYLFACAVKRPDGHMAEGDATPSQPQPGALTVASARPPRDRDQPSIVIMPFDNLSGHADGYFVDGVVEEITAALSRVREFFVVARQSAFTYKGRFVDVREVGRQLDVSYVVEGTVRRSGDRMRITVQLVDAETRQQLWSGRYEGDTTNIFEFQDRIAAQVAGAIHPALRNAEIELAKSKPPTSLRAYDLVMRAYPKLWAHNRAANDAAIALLQEAIKIDSAYGRAHALLAWCHAQNVTYVWSAAPDEDMARAIGEVDAASGSINDDPTALTAVGAAVSMYGDQERATAYFERALALDPNNAWAWTRLGWAAIYRYEPDRARERFERAMALSPVDPFAFNMRMGIAVAMAIGDRLPEALAIVKDVINKHPDATWCYRQLAAWSAWSRDLETARWAAQRLLTAQPDFTIERFRALPVARNIPHYAVRMAEGLRLAGLPEK
jgi:TolB-like protein